MENISSVKQSDIEHSRNISKPIVISSFWNSFSKKDKQNLQNVLSSDTSKVNNAIMKVLKSKGIDFKNLENFDVNDNQISKQKNRIVITNPKQEHFSKEDSVKKNMLFKLLKNKNNLKTVDGFKASFTPSSNVSEKSEKGTVSFSMTFLKSKRTKGNDVKEKKEVKLNEKEKEKFNILSSTIGVKEKKEIKLNEKEKEKFNILSSTIGLSQKVLFKAVPKAKLKKSKRKRVVVPVYIGNKKSNKSSNLKKVNLSDGNRQIDSFDGRSLVSKIKPIEEQLNELKSKSKKNKEASWKTFLEINHLSPSSNKRPKDFQLKGSTLMSNKAEENNNSTSTKLQSGEKSKENILTNKTVGPHHGSIILSKDCPSHDDENPTKSGKVTEQRIGNFSDILYDPDVLIKNHKLIIPRDISEDSLFQANPYAGCDTVLKLFKALSKGIDSSNQPKDILPKKNKEGHKEGSNTMECHVENTKKVETVPTSESETYYRTTSKSSTTPNTSSNINTGSDCSIINKNGLRNIFSLPMNFNILKKSKYSQSDENKLIDLFEAKNSESDKITKFSNDIEERTVISNLYKEENPCHVEHASGANSKTSIQNLSENLEKEITSKESIKKTSMFIKSNNSKYCVSCLNNVDIIEKKNSLTHQLQNSSTTSKELADESCHNISLGTLSERNKRSINRLELNISHEEFGISGTVKQSQKLLKKTTISCPLGTPEQKVSITILIENDLQGGKKLSSNPNIETHSFTQFREIQHLESSRDLNQLNSGKGEHTNKKNLQVSEEVPYAFCNLTSTKPTLFSKRISHHVDDANKQLICEQNEIKAMCFGLSINKSYLTEKDRKLFDEEVLGVDHNEKSIDLSNFKFRKTNQEELPGINCRPGLIILNESSADIDKADSSNQSKLDSLCNRKIVHRPRFGKCYTRNPFYMERLSKVKKQPRMKNTQEENYFRNYIKHINNIPERSVSLNKIDLPFVPNNANEFMVTGNQKFLKPQIKNNLDSTKCCEVLNPVDVKEKPCGCSLILNQEPFIKQAENSFLFPKNSQGDKIENVKTVDIEQKRNNKEFYWLNSMTDTMSSNDRFEMFRVYDMNCSPRNNKNNMHVQTNFNTENNSQIYFLSNNSKLNTTSDKTNSIVAERLLENGLSVVDDRKRTNFEEPLSNLQYKKVGNEIRRTCFSNSANKLIQDKSKNFKHTKLINSEILLCTHAFRIPERIKDKQNFNILVKSEPQLFSFKTIKPLSSRNTCNETNQERLIIDKIEDQINQNNFKKTCNCCNIGCLSVLSEEDLIDFCHTE